MKETLYCSFCGKNQNEVMKLIAGPVVFICDECVDLCAAIVTEERKGETAKLLAADPDAAQLPSYVASLKLAIEAEQRGRAELLSDLRRLEFESNAYIEALLDIAFPEKSGLSSWAGNPIQWPTTRAYQALGGRIEDGRRVDSYEDLKGDSDE